MPPSALWSGTRPTWVAAGVLVASGALAHRPAALLLGVLLAVAQPLTRLLPLDTALLAAAVLVPAAAVLSGVLAAWTGPLAHAAVAVVGVALLARTRGPAEPRRTSWWGALSVLPATAAAASALLVQDGARVAQYAFAGTDFTTHAALFSALRVQPVLDYGDDAYPRGAHLVGALASRASGATAHGTPTERLVAELGQWGSLDLLGLAALLLAVAALTRRLGRLIALPGPLAAVAGAVLALALLGHVGFLLTFVVMGTLPATLGASALLTVVLVHLDLEDSRPGLARLTALAALVVTAHCWAPLVAPAALAAAAVLVQRSGLRGAVAWCVRPGHAALLLLCAALVAVPSAAVLDSAGLVQAAAPGSLPALPVAVALAGVVAVLVLAARVPQARVLLAVCTGQVLAVLVLLRSSGWSPPAYYPTKAGWFLLVLALPALAAASAVLLERAAGVLWRAAGRVPRAHVARAVGVACLVALAVAALLPRLVVHGFPGRVALAPEAVPVVGRLTGHVDRLLELPADRTAVPFLLGVEALPQPPSTDIVFRLLDALGREQQVAWADPATLCAAVQRVRSGGLSPLVVTELPAAATQQYLAGQGCRDVEVLAVEGGDPGALRFWETVLLQQQAD